MATELKEKVSFLEESLNRFILSVNEITYNMSRDTRILKEEMKEFKEEMKEFKDEMREFKINSERDRRNMNKQWGELANRLGTFAEDFAAPNIPRIAKEYFGASEILDFGVRRVRRDRLNPFAIYEFDAIAVTDTQVFLMECKFTAKPEYVEAVPNIILNFKKCFPEYNNKELITFFASMHIPENLIQKLTDMGIYAMVTGDENMDLVNFEALQK